MRTARVLAIRPGSTPSASAAVATVAVLPSTVMIGKSGAWLSIHLATDSALNSYSDDVPSRPSRAIAPVPATRKG